MSRCMASPHIPIVIPAKAGIQYSPPSITYYYDYWIIRFRG